MIVAIIIVVIIVLVLLWAMSAYNGLVTLRNRVKNGWAQIDVQLKAACRPHSESGGNCQRLCCP